MAVISSRDPWNKGKLVGQKAPFELKDVWAIRVRLQLGNRDRELALFNLGLDSKLRASDLIKLRIRDVSHGTAIAARAIVMQRKTQRSVQFEITDQTKEAPANLHPRSGGCSPGIFSFAVAPEPSCGGREPCHACPPQKFDPVL